jgi:hypothetical protein
MSWRQFFDVLGLPIQDWNDVWPRDEPAVAEDRKARLSRKFQKVYAAMVRRRRAIESLKLQIEREPAAEFEGCRRRIQRHEGRYQILLTKMARIKRKLRASEPTAS